MLSAYQFFCWRDVYNCNKPITPEKYHTLVVDAVRRFNSCLKNNTVRGCTYSTNTHQLATHLYASMYHVYIADYMKLLPRHQLYFIQMEEHIGDLVTSVNDLCDFLEIPRFPEEKLQQFQDRDEVRNQMSRKNKLPYVLPKTTEILEKFFKPYLTDLVNLLGDEKWYWKRSL
jgi:N-acetylgalactosamine 4-sulfate 6-O-sulfotransferase